MVDKTRTTNRNVSRIANYSLSGLDPWGTPYSLSGSETPSKDLREAYNHYLRTQSWSTTAGWKAARQSQGYLATLSYQDQVTVWNQPYSLQTFHTATSGALPRGTMRCQPFVALPLGIDSLIATSRYDAAKNACILDAKYKALDKARDMKSNVAVFFGEGRQTVRMIRDTAGRLYKAYSAFRRRRFQQAADVLGIRKPSGGAANHWLEYTYGWSPLLSDAKGMAEMAAQHIALGGRPPRFTAKGSSAFKAKMVEDGSFNNTVDPPAFSQEYMGYRWLYDFEINSSAGLLCEVEYTSAALAAQLGFGLYDPLLLAWELTPFSFVFDWFIDIGSALSAISSLQGLKVLTGYSSYSQSGKGWGQGNGYVSLRYLHKQDGYVDTIPFQARRYVRSPWDGGITKIRMPLIDGLSARRLVTSAALWRQRLRGDRVPGGYKP